MNLTITIPLWSFWSFLFLIALLIWVEGLRARSYRDLVQDIENLHYQLMSERKGWPFSPEQDQTPSQTPSQTPNQGA